MFITQINKIVIGLTLLIVLFSPNPAYADSISESEAFYQRGHDYVDKFQYDLAIIEYTKAIQLNPQYARAYNSRGFSYYQNLQYDLARVDLTKAIALNPQYDLAYWNRGRVYCLMQGETYDLAIADFTKAIALNPDADYYISRAEVYRAMDNKCLAMDDYNQVLKIKPNSTLAHDRKYSLLKYGGEGGYPYYDSYINDTSYNPWR